MPRPAPYRLFFFIAALLMNPAAQSHAEWGLGVTGNLGSGFRYTRERQGDAITWTTEQTSDYTLGLSGKIVDPRLATFNIAGALSTNDFRTNQRSGIEDSRLLNLSGNLSLLPGKPYPVDLRLTKSHLSSGSGTDLLFFGGNWRIVYGNLPSIFLNFDRVNVQSTGQSKADTTFTTGSMRLAKRWGNSDLDAEFGVQNFADDIRGSSTLRHFGRFSDTSLWSPATTFRLTGDYFMEGDIRSVGSLFSLINRPDPTLNRSVSLGIRSFSGKDEQETTLDATSALSKAYQPFPTLSVTPFTTALLSQRFGSASQGDSTLLSWALGTSLVSTYFRDVLTSVDYGLGLSYINEQDDQSNLGTTHQFHVGLQSRTLAPYVVRGDYTLTLERTITERNRHLASLRAEGPLASALFFRSYAEFFNEDAKFSDLQVQTSTKQTTLTFGGALSYTGIRRLYLDLGANASRSDNQTGPSWLTRVTANLNYRPTDRMTVTVTGLKETDTRNELTRHEVLTRIQYLFGRASVNLEYRFESREIFDQPGQGHSISIRMNRPFNFSF